MRPNRAHENQYFRVIEPFTVEVEVGLAKSQVFIGSSMALEKVYQTVRLRPGDELHLLVGGDFLVRQGEAWSFGTRRQAAFEIMLHPAPFDPQLPFEKLAAITGAPIRPQAGYRREFEVGSAPAVVPQ